MTGGRLLEAAKQPGQVIAAWPSCTPSSFLAQAASQGVPVWRIEDGFVRSVGLGSDSMPPCSVVLDSQGIYYDPGKPSDLETLLQTTEFTPALLGRSAALIKRLVAERITKYNSIPLNASVKINSPDGVRRILVPGQVADDLSFRLGSCGLRDNCDLLSAVRKAAPDAYIIYKPHPDVDAGHRVGSIPDRVTLRYANQIVRGVAIPTLLDQVDEIHTATSLTGFEALLRRVPVTLYGQPFYGGWGLTTDRHPHPRRTRVLTLEELVAGTLLLYPLYLDPVTLLPCPPEVLIERIADARHWQAGLRIHVRRAHGRMRAWLLKKRQARTWPE
jgi:capsular polysaccharide export protein